MISQPLRTFSLACALIGVVLPQTGRVRGDSPRTGPAYVLVPKSAKRVKAVMTFEVKAPKVEADEWTVYVAQIPELPGQIDVRTTLIPRGKAARELSDLGRPVLYTRIPSAGERWRHEVSTRIEYEATLLNRQLERREPGDPEPPPVAPLDPRTRRLELASGHQFDHQAPAFRAWLVDQSLRREPSENEVDYARRAFLVVRKEIKHFEGASVEHQASGVCEVGKSDFAGITAVYVSALRANGIPARALGGRVAIYNGRPAKGAWVHAKVEFYAQGIGWVPADIAGAIRTNKSPDGLEFFGNDSAEFLTMHLDTDLVVDTYFGHKTLEWLPDASWWVIGGGNFDGHKINVDVTVEYEPIDLAEALAPRPSRPASKKQAAKSAR